MKESGQVSHKGPVCPWQRRVRKEESGRKRIGESGEKGARRLTNGEVLLAAYAGRGSLRKPNPQRPHKRRERHAHKDKNTQEKSPASRLWIRLAYPNICHCWRTYFIQPTPTGIIRTMSLLMNCVRCFCRAVQLPLNYRPRANQT